MEDLKETVCVKSSDPVPGAEKYQLTNQAGSSSFSSGLDTNKHDKTVTQGGIPMTLNQQDLVNRSAPASFLPPEVPTDPPPSGQSNMENVPCPSR